MKEEHFEGVAVFKLSLCSRPLKVGQPQSNVAVSLQKKKKKTSIARTTTTTISHSYEDSRKKQHSTG